MTRALAIARDVALTLAALAVFFVFAYRGIEAAYLEKLQLVQQVRQLSEQLQKAEAGKK